MIKPRRIQFDLFLLLLVLLIAAKGYFSCTALASIFRDPPAFYAQVSEWGAWGPIAMVGLQAIQVLVAPIPGQYLGMATGYLYGLLWGTALSMTGLGIGSWLAMLLARRLGRPLVERVASAEMIQRLDSLSRRHGLWAFFLVFSLPFLPTDVGCFIAGLTPLPIASLLVLAVLGRLPGVLLLNWLGSTSQALGPTAVAGLMAGAVLVAAVMIRYRAQFQERMFALLQRIEVS